MARIFNVCLLRCIVAISILFNSFDVSAKGGSEHINDIRQVFPFSSEKPVLSEFYRAIQAAMDYQVFRYPFTDRQVGNPLFLKRPPFERTVWGNHRIWYHWGFNKFNKAYVEDVTNPLGKAIRRNIEENRMSESDLPLFYYELQEENRKRNMALMKYASKVLGYPEDGWSSAMRRQINAFVTIPYSVHLLGDHFPDQSETYVISPLSDVVGDIYNAIYNLAGSSSGNYTKAKKLIAALKLKESDPVAFLNALKRHFAGFILSLEGGIYDYKSKFTRMGYELKPVE